KHFHLNILSRKFLGFRIQQYCLDHLIELLVFVLLSLSIVIHKSKNPLHIFLALSLDHLDQIFFLNLVSLEEVLEEVTFVTSFFLTLTSPSTDRLLLHIQFYSCLEMVYDLTSLVECVCFSWCNLPMYFYQAPYHS